MTEWYPRTIVDDGSWESAARTNGCWPMTCHRLDRRCRCWWDVLEGRLPDFLRRAADALAGEIGPKEQRKWK
jgi:hypothetical protein